MQLDHVILAAPVRGPDTPRLPSSYGLEPVPGGRHPAWGTANWIVPLGDSYLELIAVVDEHVAGGNDFGRRVLDASEGDLIGWAVRPDDIDATATRLGLSRPRIPNALVLGAHRVADGRSRGRSRAAVAPVLRGVA